MSDDFRGKNGAPTTAASSRLSVVSTANAYFFPGLLVALYSLLRNLAPSQAVDFTVLTDSLEERHRLALERVLRAAGRDFTLRLLPIELDQYDDYPAHIGSKLTYARLMVPRLIEADRVLYLDSDIVVMKDVSRLTALPWQDGHVLYAVNDTRIPVFSMYWEDIPCQALGIPPAAPYFNAGFLWINLAEWRRQGVDGACQEYMRRFPDRLRLFDQSALNAVLWNRWTPLEKSWNQVPEDSLGRFALYPLAHTTDANIHYLGGGKPWTDLHPFRQFHQTYAAEIAPLLPAEMAFRGKLPGGMAKRLNYFARRAFWNYGGSCKRAVRKLAGRR